MWPWDRPEPEIEVIDRTEDEDGFTVTFSLTWPGPESGDLCSGRSPRGSSPWPSWGGCSDSARCGGGGGGGDDD